MGRTVHVRTNKLLQLHYSAHRADEPQQSSTSERLQSAHGLHNGSAGTGSSSKAVPGRN